MTTHVVDHVAGHAAAETDALNELVTLRRLAFGLHTLANTVKSLERQAHERVRPEDGPSFFFGSGMPGLSQANEALLPCLFHWYGVTICNYARLVGFLSGLSSSAYKRDATEDESNYGLIKSHCTAYCASIREIEPILLWRNKVFAHFAITAPRVGEDNAALLDVSTMSPIAFFNARFRVGGVVIQCRGAEVELPNWSITESFEQLAPRFWPAMRI